MFTGIILIGKTRWLQEIFVCEWCLPSISSGLMFHAKNFSAKCLNFLVVISNLTFSHFQDCVINNQLFAFTSKHPAFISALVEGNISHFPCTSHRTQQWSVLWSDFAIVHQLLRFTSFNDFIWNILVCCRAPRLHQTCYLYRVCSFTLLCTSTVSRLKCEAVPNLSVVSCLTKPSCEILIHPDLVGQREKWTVDA